MNCNNLCVYCLLLIPLWFRPNFHDFLGERIIRRESAESPNRPLQGAGRSVFLCRTWSGEIPSLTPAGQPRIVGRVFYDFVSMVVRGVKIIFFVWHRKWCVRVLKENCFCTKIELLVWLWRFPFAVKYVFYCFCLLALFVCDCKKVHVKFDLIQFNFRSHQV